MKRYGYPTMRKPKHSKLADRRLSNFLNHLALMNDLKALDSLAESSPHSPYNTALTQLALCYPNATLTQIDVLMESRLYEVIVADLMKLETSYPTSPYMTGVPMVLTPSDTWH